MISLDMQRAGSRLAGSFFGLFIAVVLLASLPAQAAKVAAIKVLGATRIEPDAVTERMSLKRGSEISAAAVRRDILSIFDLGYFEDVRISEEGGTLIVNVRERPVVEKISFEGASEFETKELEETSGLKAFKVLNLGEIQEAKAKIIQRYEEKGYYLASAQHEIVRSGDNGAAELVIRINENDRVRIRKILFLGNKRFSAAELKQVMQSSEGNFFSWATSGGTYREDMFERDLSMLAFFYGNLGYIQAKFAKPRVTLSQDRRYVDIVIDVDEGHEFKLGQVEFDGDLLFAEDDLRKNFGLSTGETFSTGVLQGEIIKLTDKYGDDGYAFANVIPRPRVVEGKDVVDLLISVEPGEKAYWGKITVSGNSKTHDKVLRRELPFNEGELYNATKRKKGFERIQRLGFFGSDVNFLTSSPESKNNVIDLEIKVDEKPTGSLNVSAGYGNSQGFIFGAQVAQNNLFGLGRQLSFNLNLSFSSNKATTPGSTETRAGSKTFNLSYTDPHINDSDYLFGTDLFVEEYPVGYNPKTYDKRSSGGSLKLGKELRESLYVYSTYRLHHTLFRDVVNPKIFTSPRDGESYVSALSLSLEYDTRNNRLDPSGGAYVSTSGEIAGLGGRQFLGVNASARYYKKIIGSLVYRTRVEYGLLWAYGGDSVPDSQRYVLGGVFSIRGYDPYTVGPTKRVASQRAVDNGAEASYVVGGSQKVVINHELEFTLIPEANIRGVLFFDAGNAWNGSLSKLSPTILSNYGWGIRWYSPLGPLRFEWGYPLVLSELKRDYGSVFNFIIAPSF